MFALRGNRKTILTVMLAIAVLAVAIPTCVMIGCDMGNMCGGMTAALGNFGSTFSNQCAGTVVANAGQIGIVSSELLTMLMALVAIVAAFLMFAPRVHFEPVRLVDANAPPPPLEPRGERWLL